MDTYVFRCRRCRSTSVESSSSSLQNLHLLLGILTLGAWFVLRGFERVWTLYRLSRCEDCGRRNRWLLSLLVFFVMGTLEVGWLVYYFVEVAPEKIVRDASSMDFPDLQLDLENMELKEELDREQYWEVINYILVVGILPGVGSFIYDNWPFILLAWFGLIALVGLMAPSWYLKKTPL